MDHFNLCMDLVSLAGQSVLHLFFTCRLTGKRPRAWCFALYFSLLCVIEAVSRRLIPEGVLPLGAGILALCCLSRFALGNSWPASWLAAILAFYISQLSFGMINSVECLFFSGLIGTSLLYVLLAGALLVFFALCSGCYAAVLKLLDWKTGWQTPYVGLLLFPTLFFFAVQLYILHTAYTSFTPLASLEEAGRHGALLFLQVMGLGALLCTLYAYQRLCRGLRSQADVRALSQAARAQKVYVAEARARYEQTRSFRHDIQNHLSVLNGLLREGRLEEGKAYLQKLEAAAAPLTLPSRTGNPVVDIVLGEKLGLAQSCGISTEASVALPSSCGVDDFDWCVLFANALDNAVCACQAVEGEKSIRVIGERQGDFYRLAFENTCLEGPAPPAGTGMLNMEAVVKKYRGAALTEKTGRRFSLHILLDISLHPESISDQLP